MKDREVFIKKYHQLKKGSKNIKEKALANSFNSKNWKNDQ